jgi:hypothetical protein
METTGQNAIGAAMSYDQALQFGYKEQVEAVSKVQADYTGRLMDDPAIVEFSASKQFVGADGEDYTITVYFYQDAADLNAIDDGDLGVLDWTPAKYEIS